MTEHYDRDEHAVTEHTLVFDVDPQQDRVELITAAGTIRLRLDADPAQVGAAVLAYLRPARKAALADDRRPRRINGHNLEGGGLR